MKPKDTKGFVMRGGFWRTARRVVKFKGGRQVFDGLCRGSWIAEKIGCDHMCVVQFTFLMH